MQIKFRHLRSAPRQFHCSLSTLLNTIHTKSAYLLVVWLSYKFQFKTSLARPHYSRVFVARGAAFKLKKAFKRFHGYLRFVYTPIIKPKEKIRIYSITSLMKLYE